MGLSHPLAPPDRGFVHPDCHDVESTTFRGDVCGHSLTKYILFQCHPFNIMARLGREVFGIALHTDHIAVVHSGDGNCIGVGSACR